MQYTKNKIWIFIFLLTLSLAGLSFILFDSSLIVFINLLISAIAFILFLLKELSFKTLPKTGAIFFYLVSLALGIAVYLIIFKTNQRFDFDLDPKLKLTSDTIEVLERVKTPITAAVIYGVKGYDQSKYRHLKDLVERTSDYIHFKLIDPSQQLELVDQKWKLQAGDLMVLEKESGEYLKLETLAETDFRETLENLIGTQQQIAIIDPDGLFSTDSSADGFKRLIEVLSKSGFAYQIFKDLPEDPSYIKLFLPYKSSILQGKTVNLDQALVILDPIYGSAGSELLNSQGAGWNQVVVLDELEDHQSDSKQEIAWQVTNYPALNQPLEKMFNQKNNPIFLMSGSFNLQQNSSCSAVLKSASKSWGETNLIELLSDQPQTTKTSEDLLGEQTTAIACQTNSKVLAFADLEWLRNANLDLQSHRRMFINSLRWISGKKLALEDAQAAPEVKLLSPGIYRHLLLIAFVIFEFMLLTIFVVNYLRQKKNYA